MNKDKRIKCNAIIHAASAAAGSVGAGLAQVPGTDSSIIVPIQIAMTVSLGKVFGIRLSKASAKSAMGTGMTTLVGRAASQVLVGWIPVAGNIINAATAASITEALGWILAKEFEEDSEKKNLIPEIEGTAEPGQVIELAQYSEVEPENEKAESSRLKIIKEVGNQLRFFQKIRDVG